MIVNSANLVVPNADLQVPYAGKGFSLHRELSAEFKTLPAGIALLLLE
jgi:hypothetical protein